MNTADVQEWCRQALQGRQELVTLGTQHQALLLALQGLLAGGAVVNAGAGKMSLSKVIFRRGRVVKKSKFDNLGGSSVEALERVEAECDWSDAALRFAELAPEPHQSKEPPACSG